MNNLTQHPFSEQSLSRHHNIDLSQKFNFKTASYSSHPLKNPLGPFLDSSVQVLGTSQQFVRTKHENIHQIDKENNWNSDMRVLQSSYQHQVDLINQMTPNIQHLGQIESMNQAQREGRIINKEMLDSLPMMGSINMGNQSFNNGFNPGATTSTVIRQTVQHHHDEDKSDYRGFNMNEIESTLEAYQSINPHQQPPQQYTYYPVPEQEFTETPQILAKSQIPHPHQHETPYHQKVYFPLHETPYTPSHPIHLDNLKYHPFMSSTQTDGSVSKPNNKQSALGGTHQIYSKTGEFSKNHPLVLKTNQIQQSLKQEVSRHKQLSSKSSNRRRQSTTYERHLQWDKQRKSRIEQMRESLSYQKKDDCTFSPQVGSPRMAQQFKHIKAAERTRNTNDYEEQLQKHVNRLTITQLRKEYERQVQALTPGSGKIWNSQNKRLTVGRAPNITGLNSPQSRMNTQSVNQSIIQRSQSRENSRNRQQTMIKSLQRPLSPPSGAHTAERKRHTMYPKTEMVSRLLSGKNSVQSSKYQTIQQEFMNQSIVSGGCEIVGDRITSITETKTVITSPDPYTPQNQNHQVITKVHQNYYSKPHIPNISANESLLDSRGRNSQNIPFTSVNTSINNHLGGLSQQNHRSNSNNSQKGSRQVVNCQTFIDILHKHIQALPI